MSSHAGFAFVQLTELRVAYVNARFLRHPGFLNSASIQSFHEKTHSNYILLNSVFLKLIGIHLIISVFFEFKSRKIIDH